MQLSVKAQSIWLSAQPIDFRAGIDRLLLQLDNAGYSGIDGTYIFYNKGRDKLKILSWHKNGFILLMKRLESGKFHLGSSGGNKQHMGITEEELMWLLAGLDWQILQQSPELPYTNYV